MEKKNITSKRWHFFGGLLKIDNVSHCFMFVEIYPSIILLLDMESWASVERSRTG